MRVLLPQKPKAITATCHATPIKFEHYWYKESRTLLLLFENNPEGIRVEINW